MSYIENKLLSPLSREYCAYFYYLTVFTLFFFAIALVETTYSIVNGKVSILRGLIGVTFPFVIYFQNRLMYSMCIR